MALRLIEIIGSEQSQKRIEEILDDHDVLEHWSRELADGRRQMHVLLETGSTEALLDHLETYHSNEPGFRLLLRQVEATIPVIKKDEPAPEEKVSEKTDEKKVLKRISRQELHNSIEKGAESGTYFYLNIVIATVVAAIGLVRSDTAVIIAAMVIAPLLGPNMALALGTTLGEKSLIKTSLLTNAKGLALTLFVSLLVSLGLYLHDETLVLTSAAIEARTNFNWIDVVLALAAGAAGALAFIYSAAGNLVGVMVAVALLPPMLCTVLLATHGDFDGAGRSLMLFVANVAGANIAAVSVFLLNGIQPRTWWEADRAKRAARRALVAWTFVIAVLVAIIVKFPKAG